MPSVLIPALDIWMNNGSCFLYVFISGASARATKTRVNYLDLKYTIESAAASAHWRRRLCPLRRTATLVLGVTLAIMKTSLRIRVSKSCLDAQSVQTWTSHSRPRLRSLIAPYYLRDITRYVLAWLLDVTRHVYANATFSNSRDCTLYSTTSSRDSHERAHECANLLRELSSAAHATNDCSPRFWSGFPRASDGYNAWAGRKRTRMQIPEL